MYLLDNFKKQAQAKSNENKTFYKRLKLKQPRDLDEQFHKLHEEVFEKIDCLACANCCKTTSPIFYEKDIERLSKHFRIKPSAFIDKYLKIDEDKDYVLTQAPCPFLGTDNYCSLYDHRPNACREYPHTNRKRMQQITELTYKNTLVCPAVFEITEQLKKIYHK